MTNKEKDEIRAELFRPDEQCGSCKSWLRDFINLQNECFHPNHPSEGTHPCEDWEEK